MPLQGAGLCITEGQSRASLHLRQPIRGGTTDILLTEKRTQLYTDDIPGVGDFTCFTGVRQTLAVLYSLVDCKRALLFDSSA